jgi:hypothetical protein
MSNLPPDWLNEVRKSPHDWLTELYYDINAIRYHGGGANYFSDEEAKAMFIKAATETVLKRAEEYFPSTVRRVMPLELVPTDLVGVCPMAPPTGDIFKLRAKYTNDDKTNPDDINRGT